MPPALPDLAGALRHASIPRRPDPFCSIRNMPSPPACRLPDLRAPHGVRVPDNQATVCIRFVAGTGTLRPSRAQDFPEHKSTRCAHLPMPNPFRCARVQIAKLDDAPPPRSDSRLLVRSAPLLRAAPHSCDPLRHRESRVSLFRLRWARVPPWLLPFPAASTIISSHPIGFPLKALLRARYDRRSKREDSLSPIEFRKRFCRQLASRSAR